MSNETKYGIGSDPEVFVTDPSGKIVPVTGLVGGTKDEPLNLGNGYAVQEDGVALEYNIPVSSSVKEFCEAMKEGLRLASSRLPKGYGTIIKPDHVFERNQLVTASQWLSGCDPDFSAWSLAEREGLNYENAKQPLARYCGGHIHISYQNPEKQHPMTKLFLVRMADLLIGVPCRWMEGNSIRSQEFGAFGIYRPKKYGLEYRTASNVWLSDNNLMEWVAEAALFLSKYANTAPRMYKSVFSEEEVGTDIQLDKFKTLSKDSLDNWWQACAHSGINVSDTMYHILKKKINTKSTNMYGESPFSAHYAEIPAQQKIDNPVLIHIENDIADIIKPGGIFRQRNW